MESDPFYSHRHKYKIIDPKKKKLFPFHITYSGIVLVAASWLGPFFRFEMEALSYANSLPKEMYMNS